MWSVSTAVGHVADMSYPPSCSEQVECGSLTAVGECGSLTAVGECGSLTAAG